MRKQTYVFPNGQRFTAKDLLGIIKDKGTEVVTKPYNTAVLDKVDKLTEDEFMFCLMCIIEGAKVYAYFKKNERTDKESFLNEFIFEKV